MGWGVDRLWCECWRGGGFGGESFGSKEWGSMIR